jgi:hypothetical protein
MGMNYWHFAKIYGSSVENTKIMIQGLMYMEVQDYYEDLVDAYGVKEADDIMKTLMDYGWNAYINAFNRMNPIDYGMAFAFVLEEWLEGDFEYDLKNDIEDYIDYYFDMAINSY